MLQRTYNDEAELDFFLFRHIVRLGVGMLAVEVKTSARARKSLHSVDE